MDYATSYLEKIVKIKVDRPLGTKHPKWDYIYPINYGFVPNTKAPDGCEIDAYILGVEEPLEEFTGKCIAVIHRTNDEDDKLIIVAENVSFSDEEIKKLTEFQEKFFESKIIRTKY
ncbi:inorganic pyrophosphatase [Candidatus Woesearchaeota archaeon]|jgi:inorganic pyrophosphatase|nr:inorganic pyrophosphatase [Candidatus Woesearchaeota archaeon]MBT5740650.1 inorganic pyrophosphatase [Candidatus Woesearchaeota archaeon]MBT6402500.1 inorganic pyrophosphatase [Candidatus Woesearchaeota archaeon]